MSTTTDPVKAAALDRIAAARDVRRRWAALPGVSKQDALQHDVVSWRYEPHAESESAVGLAERFDPDSPEPSSGGEHRIADGAAGSIA